MRKLTQLSDRILCDKLNDWIICKVDKQTNCNQKPNKCLVIKINQNEGAKRKEKKKISHKIEN